LVVIQSISSTEIVLMKKKDKKILLIQLAKRVKELRKAKGVTQADALTDTKILFSRIEQGKRNISFTTLFEICKYFDITMDEFFKDKF